MLYDDLTKYGLNIKKYAGEFGIEIETEAKSKYEITPMTFWTVHKDDSLRGPAPYEYVLRQPLKFKNELPEALSEFKEKTKNVDFDQKSFTTSVHVHVNMLNEKYVTMGNFLTIYSMVENLLKKYAGVTRESNLFCLPLCDAEENLGNIIHILKQINQKKFNQINLNAGDAKYAALNMCSLSKFGSLEVRLLRGVTDTEIIHEWVGILNSILEFSRQNLNPKDVMKLWRDKETELLSDIFGAYRKKLRYDNETALINQNFWYAANIAMCVPDWEELDKAPPAKKASSFKDFDLIAMKLYGKKFDDLPEQNKYYIVQNFQYIDMQQPPKKGVKLHNDGPFNPEDWIIPEPVVNNAAPAALKPWIIQEPQPVPEEDGEALFLDDVDDDLDDQGNNGEF